MRLMLTLPWLLAAPVWAQVASVTATVETTPALTGGDSVDDPAIWVHPTDPAASLVIGTDKQNGLFVYEMTGQQRQRLNDGEMGNVDLRYNFPLGGQRVALVAANNRTTNGWSLYAVDPAARQLRNVGQGPLPTGIVTYGACMYRSEKTGKYYAFDDDKDGVVQQWELADDGTGKVKATKVRQFDVGGQVEGCVADDVLGALYVGEEDVGVWRYDAEPSGGATRTRVDGTQAGGHLTADVEGLAIYPRAQGTGYLVVSSQGDDTFAVYRREGDNAYLGTFRIADGAIDGVTECDGIEVSNLPLGPGFSQGAFIAQDFSNPGANQNFKLVPWERIAAALTPPLAVDPTGFDPRLQGLSPPSDAGVRPDAGRPDAGTPTLDAGPLDAGHFDAGGAPLDGPDAGEGPAGDAPPDAGPMGSTLPPPAAPAPMVGPSSIGCASLPHPLLLAALLPLARRWRRRTVRPGHAGR